MIYKEEEYLQLSGLQHFSFCRRQWALIHIEKLWADNYKTADGNIMHERVHNETIKESHNGFFSVRGVSVFSPSLGISGQCDVVEYHANPQGIMLKGHDGRWAPYPIEYKRGSPKDTDVDRLQLCAQAMCLEEMLCCDIPEGAIFYGEPRRRERVELTDELRDHVKRALIEMHEYYKRGYTPKGRRTKSCNACSLKDLCLPELTKVQSVATYMKRALEDLS